jgi:hypothetical protein
MSKTIGTNVYWYDGTLIGHKRITLRTDSEGVIVNDGRVVTNVNGVWKYYPK